MQQPPADFVDIATVMPDLLVDARYASTENFTGQRVPGYETSRLMLTQAAAQALHAVQLAVAEQGMNLKVLDAYRPQRAVDFFLQWTRGSDDTRLKAAYYPAINKAELFALGYLVQHSSHSRGSTVDLTLVDSGTGIELDMGTDFDFFDERSRPDSRAVTDKQRDNRLRLSTVMLQQGFVPLEAEWWHFTLRDEPYPQTYFDFIYY